MFTEIEMQKLSTQFDMSYMSENTLREFHRAGKDWRIRQLRGEKQGDIFTKISGSYNEAIAYYVQDAFNFLKDN